MADVLEPARSGRSRCRGCGATIEKGSLRFGEELPNPYGDEGETALRWFHLACAAEKRPEKVGPVLDRAGLAPADLDALRGVIEEGVRNPQLRRVARAEPAPTGRARCRECRALIERGTWRVVIDVEDEAASMASTYSLHAACAARHVGAEGLRQKLQRTSRLPADAAADLDEALAAPPPAGAAAPDAPPAS
jgi:hypothetical protein